MNEYEERKQARIERLEAAADRAAARADSLFGHAHEQLRHHTGEPIKVGHHSERRHRRDIERHDNTMRRAFEAQRAAQATQRGLNITSEYFTRQGRRVDTSSRHRVVVVDDRRRQSMEG